jgi:glyoxalase family protein
LATILGLHHVTAIAGDPQQNIDFYAGLLGLRLVKLTVNYDDPTAYHVYYGDAQGHPGTILTFFSWPGAMRGRGGTGQVTVTSFAVPGNSLSYWNARLRERGIAFEETESAFNEPLVSFSDPDGTRIELVSAAEANPDRSWDGGDVPAEFAICGFHHVTLSEEGYERTASLLTDTMGFRVLREERNRFRYAVGSGEPGTLVDLLCVPGAKPGRIAVGTVHHVAWRTPSDEEQVLWRKTIGKLNYNVSPIIDRTYFHSIYFREPGGVLFEIATDPPGFGVDEPSDQLGSHLVLPPWLEASRSELEQLLPQVHIPASIR